MTNTTFIMTVSHNDISGERGEPYMLVPLAARDYDPEFWGWDADFTAPIQYQERVVQVIDDGVRRTARIYLVDERSEFRLATELYAAGPAAAGSLLEVTRAPRPGVDYEYRLHLPGSVRYELLLGLASHAVHNSDKRWGYQ